MGKNVIISTLPNISQNYLPKVNTSNIFANSLVYDDGSSVLINTTTASAFKLDVNGTGRFQGALTGTSATFSGQVDAASFYTNDTRYVSNQIQAGYNTNAEDVDLWVNYSGYQGGTTRFRDFRIGNGKNGQIAFFDGSTSAATFSSSLSLGSYLTGQGTNPGGLGGSRYVIDHYNGNMRIFSYGDNTSTNGGFTFNSQRSDGTNSINFLSIATSGAATFSGDVNVGNGSAQTRLLIDSLGGSGQGPFIRFNKANVAKAYIGAYSGIVSGTSDDFGLYSVGGYQFMVNNSTSTVFSIASTGAATFGSSVQLSSLVTAPSYGSGSTGLNIGYMNFQNVIGIQACYANNIYYDGANWKSISSTVPWAAAVRLQAGNIDFHSASVTSSGQTMSNWDTTDLKMRITSGGNVGIGISNPSYLLHIPQNNNLFLGNIYISGSANNPNLGSGATGGSLTLAGGGNGEGKIYIQGAASGGNGYVEFYTNSALRMTIASNGNIGAPSGTNIYNASDLRLKRNISTLSDGLDKILNLNPVKFNWIEGFEPTEEDKDMFGFIAQEVLSVVPEAVESFSNNDIVIGENVIKSPLRVNEKFIIPVLVKAIQELKAENDQQKADIESLKALINK